MHGIFPLLLLAASATGAAPPPRYIANRASRTTKLVRELVLQKLERIAGKKECRQSFVRENSTWISFEQQRTSPVLQCRAPQGELRFSDPVGKPASPD